MVRLDACRTPLEHDAGDPERRRGELHLLLPLPSCL